MPVKIALVSNDETVTQKVFEAFPKAKIVCWSGFSQARNHLTEFGERPDCVFLVRSEESREEFEALEKIAWIVGEVSTSTLVVELVSSPLDSTLSLAESSTCSVLSLAISDLSSLKI